MELYLTAESECWDSKGRKPHTNVWILVVQHSEIYFSSIKNGEKLNVGVLGLEPRISCSQNMRLSQLGHTPLVPRDRFELSTQGFSILCSTPELPRLFFYHINQPIITFITLIVIFCIGCFLLQF